MLPLLPFLDFPPSPFDSVCPPLIFTLSGFDPISLLFFRPYGSGFIRCFVPSVSSALLSLSLDLVLPSFDFIRAGLTIQLLDLFFRFFL